MSSFPNITDELWNLEIIYNSNLSLCNAGIVCNHLSYGRLATVYSNATGCQDFPDLVAACNLSGYINIVNLYANKVTICESDSITLNATVTVVGAAPTYQWQSSDQAYGTYVNIPGAVTVPYTMAINAPTYF